MVVAVNAIVSNPGCGFGTTGLFGAPTWLIAQRETMFLALVLALKGQRGVCLPGKARPDRRAAFMVGSRQTWLLVMFLPSVRRMSIRSDTRIRQFSGPSTTG